MSCRALLALRGGHKIVCRKTNARALRQTQKGRDMPIRHQPPSSTLLSRGLPHRDTSSMNADSLCHGARATKGRYDAACRFHVPCVANLATSRKTPCSEFRYR